MKAFGVRVFLFMPCGRHLETMPGKLERAKLKAVKAVDDLLAWALLNTKPA